MASGGPFRIGSFVLTEQEVEKRKGYFEIREEDEQLLREAHRHVVDQVGTIVDRFYDFLLSHQHTRQILSAPGLVERLKKIQTQYFLELTSGHYDLSYFENRLRVGLAHERIRLSPEWYIGAYDKYLHIVTDVLSLAFGRDYDRFFRTAVALTKVISLDMSLAIDAYIYSAQERLAQKAAALEQANLELRKLDAAKRRLTDTIVHDLQNPLAGIVAFLRILEERRPALSEEERRSLGEALARCNDISQLILNVLQISRAEDGQLELYLENFDLAEIARSSVDAFSLVAEQGGRHLRFAASDGPVMLRSDQSLLRRILYNLIRNGLRHTPPGTEVVVGVHRGPPLGVSVRDNGPGIPAELQARAFEPGALRSAGLPVDSGVGLSFCKMAADALGMELRLESKQGEGACFILEQSRREGS